MSDPRTLTITSLVADARLPDGYVAGYRMTLTRSVVDQPYPETLRVMADYAVEQFRRAHPDLDVRTLRWRVVTETIDLPDRD